MEGVGARLGRSSTRYGPTTVFSGPVRKWKKKWVPIAAPSNATAVAANGNGNGNNHSHLFVFKWTPISQSNPSKDSADAAAPRPTQEDQPKRRFRYVPVSVIEDQKQEIAVKSDEENKLNDANPSLQATQTDGFNGKPDINDVAMEEAQASDKNQAATDEAKETNLDLSLGLKAHDGNRDAKNAEQREGNGREDVEMKPATNSESENRLKRKAVVPDLEMRV